MLVERTFKLSDLYEIWAGANDNENFHGVVHGSIVLSLVIIGQTGVFVLHCQPAGVYSDLFGAMLHF